MVRRALVVWLLMLLAASANGAVRDSLLIPIMGDFAGRALSTLMLSIIVVFLTWLTIRWIDPRGRRDTWIIGGLWVVLTLAFEFVGGHFLFGTQWSQLLEDYNVLRGRIWVVALVTIAVAPRACARGRRLVPS